MAETEFAEERSVSGALLAVVAISLLAALGGLFWCCTLQKNLGATEQKLTLATQKEEEEEEKNTELNQAGGDERSSASTSGDPRPERRHDAEAA